MSATTRRAIFNPTSIPELRTRPTHHRNYAHLTRFTVRPQPATNLRTKVKNIRRESTSTGEDNTGHIKKSAEEGILFFDNLFPLKLRWVLRIPWLQSDRNLPQLLNSFNNSTLSAIDPLVLVKRAIPKTMPMKVTEILPRLKDGGAFVKFSHPNGLSAVEIEETLKGYLRETNIKPWFSPFRRIRCNLVQGKPWLEDLYRFPSERLRVEFIPTRPDLAAAELSQETLYSLFRRYGKLAEITSQPSDSKVLPRFAYLDFATLRQSIMARNCMHGFTVDAAAGGGTAGTVLRLSYERRVATNYIREWLVNHPRFVIPAAAALVATITVAIFDPVRTFFIRAHVDHSFRITESRIYKWFASQARELGDAVTQRRKTPEQAGISAIWDDRKTAIDQMQTWLMETVDTFIVVQGPRGSGKKELIMDQALHGRKNVLVIDCKPIQEARNDSATIAAAAAEVGYRPVFSWMNSISSLVDLAAQGTIGVKSGFSETLDTQLAKIWTNTATALKQIAISGRKKTDKDFDLTDDDYLEAHPEHRPVVVIDNFLHKTEEGGVVYDKIAEWAARLTQSNIAHVIFLTNDISYSKSLTKALPDRVFRQISLDDITPEVAKKFVLNHLDAEDDGPPLPDTKELTTTQRAHQLENLDACIAILGGRLTDLEFLARRLKTGQTPEKAVAEIIEQSASEVLKMFLITSKAEADKKWSREQAWYLVKQLAEHESLRYNEVLLTNTFAASTTPSATSGESVLEALSQAELISIKSSRGRPSTIKTGKPVYAAAFRKLAGDEVLRSRLDLALLTELAKIEAKSIEKWENELVLLGGLPSQPYELNARIAWLLGKVEAAQKKVEGWEGEMGGLKRVLQGGE